MSNFNINQSNRQKDIFGQSPLVSQGAIQKNACTTKFTQSYKGLRLPQSFVEGKNDFLDKNTQSGLDSDDNSSQLSFEERLDLDHQKTMVSSLYKYFSANTFANQNILLDERINLKTHELLKQIQQKTIEQIQRKHGHDEAQKIKYVIKFIRKNQDTAKIFIQVLQIFTPQHRVSCFFLFKQTVLIYLNARSELKRQWKTFDQTQIKAYFCQNLTKICRTILANQKLTVLKFDQDDYIMNQKFQELIYSWMTSFFLSKQGFPSVCSQKNPNNRQWMFEDNQQGQIRKKIKK